MADRKIEIDVIANDEASAVYKKVTNSTISMADKINESIIKFGTGVRSYNIAMSDFNRTALHVFESAGRAVYNFTEEAINNFTELEKQHAKTLGAMANNYDKTAASQARFLEDSKKLKDDAIKLGTVGPGGNGSLYKAADVSYAQTALIKAGKTAPQIVKSGVTNDILKFAGGNDLTIDQATDFAVNLGTQFDIPMEKWGSMLDKVTRAADISVVDVPDVMESIKYAGGIASGLGRPLEEVLGAIAVMGNAGLKGTMSGTGLQAIFTRILNPTGITSTSTPPTKAVENKYKEFQTKVTDKSGNLKPLADITPELDKAMDSMSDKEQAWFAKKLFGLFQMKAAYALKKQGVNGENVLQDTIDTINKTSAGTNNNKWDIMLNSQPGKITALQNAYNGIQTDVGNRLSPAVAAISDELYKFLSNNGNYNIDFSKLKDAINKSGDQIGEQYGKQLGRVVSQIGNAGIDAGRIGAAIAPTGVGLAGFFGKLAGGDVTGAFETLNQSLNDTNKSIDGLPEDLQGVARGANNVILAFATLSAINLASKVLEVFTNIYNNTVGKVIRSAIEDVKKINKTDIAAGSADIKAEIAKATTETMNVTANVVNVNGGGAGAGGGKTVVPAVGGAGAGAAGVPLLGSGLQVAPITPFAAATAGIGVGLLANKVNNMNLDAQSKSADAAQKNIEANKTLFEAMGDVTQYKEYQRFRLATLPAMDPTGKSVNDVAKTAENEMYKRIIDSVPQDYKSILYGTTKQMGFDNTDTSRIAGQSYRYYYDKAQQGIPVSKEEFTQLVNKLVTAVQNANKQSSSLNTSSFRQAEKNNIVGPKQVSMADDFKSFLKSQSVTNEITTNTTVRPNITLNPQVNVRVTVDGNGNVINQKTTSLIPSGDNIVQWWASQTSRYGAGQNK